MVELLPGESYRLIVAKGAADETGCRIGAPEGVGTNLHEVFDRAHFPTVSIEREGRSRTDLHPLPIYPPR